MLTAVIPLAAAGAPVAGVVDAVHVPTITNAATLSLSVVDHGKKLLGGDTQVGTIGGVETGCPLRTPCDVRLTPPR